ncbi:MAG: hypothetical protein ACP5T2_01380 [Thermoprotei archaeon]
MTKNKPAKAIQGASWSNFWDKADWKVEQNGILAIAEETRDSTQECPACHANHRVALSENREDLPAVYAAILRRGTSREGDPAAARDGATRIHTRGDINGWVPDSCWC